MSQPRAGNGRPQMDGDKLDATEEARLVAAAKNGDQNAFAALVKATQAEIYTLAYRLTGNEHDARDVAQEAYLRAYKSLKRFRGEARFSTWMYRITANCAATLLSARSKDPDSLPEGFDPVDDGAEVDLQGLVEANLTLDKVIEAMASLPPMQRAALVLWDAYGLTHRQIGQALRISEGASKRNLSEARQQLRARLYRRDLDPTGPNRDSQLLDFLRAAFGRSGADTQPHEEGQLLHAVNMLTRRVDPLLHASEVQVGRLSEAQHQVVTLWRSGLGMQEVADTLGITRKQTNNALVNARLRLGVANIRHFTNKTKKSEGED